MMLEITTAVPLEVGERVVTGKTHTGALLGGLIMFCFSLGVCSICDNSLSGILRMLGTFLYMLHFRTKVQNNSNK